MPETSEKILAQLNTEKRGIEQMSEFGLYPSGNKVVPDPDTLFMRQDLKEVMKEVEKRHPNMAKAEEEAEEAAKKNSKKEAELAKGGTPKTGASDGAGTAAAAAGEEDASADGVMDAEPKEEISIDDFGKLQIQVGEIVSCEEVKKSKKLLCSQVKIGSKTRQIVSGIKKWYSPADMVGKRVLVITNLKPAKLAGILSEGMILCAEDDAGNLSLVSPEKSVKVGAEVR